MTAFRLSPGNSLVFDCAFLAANSVGSASLPLETLIAGIDTAQGGSVWYAD